MPGSFGKCYDPSGSQFDIPTYPWRYAPKGLATRRTCPVCRTDAGYVIPGSLGMCVPCAYSDDEQCAA
ncbi:hypothetical protein [Streptomyces mirabilis]